MFDTFCFAEQKPNTKGTRLMNHITKLESLLQTQFCWHKSRINLMSLFIVSLVKVRTVNLTQIALSLNPLVSASSNYRRLQRFFALFEFDFNLLARFIVALLPVNGKFILTLDRTNWKLGKANINLLVLAIAYKGIAFPVFWSMLDKRGNSNTLERVELLNRFIDLFGKTSIKCLLADREFIGADWITYLKKEQIHFYIRIRNNAKVSSNRKQCRIDHLFKHLSLHEYCCLPTSKILYSHKLRIAGLRLLDEYLIVITNHLPEKAINYYKERWQIETLFGALKTRGFNFEDTHLINQERISKLMGLLAITFCWAHLVGEWRHSIKPIKIKKHKRLAKSIFRYGLDYLREILLNIQFKTAEFKKVVQFLSCT